jgi:hypothetical protein
MGSHYADLDCRRGEEFARPMRAFRPLPPSTTRVIQNDHRIEMTGR